VKGSEGTSLAGLRLVVYHDGAGPGIGGSEMSVGTLIHHLDPGIDVIVLGVDENVAGWIAHHRPTSSVKVVPPVVNKRDVRGMLRLAQTVRKLRPDILQVDLQTLWSGKYAVLAGLLAPGVKVVAVDHTPVPAHNRQAVWAKRVLTRMTSANVAVSESLARHVEDLARLRGGSVRVIYNGISDVGEPALPRRGRDVPVVGTIGRLTKQKGVDVFLRAMKDVPHATGLIVGDGAYREDLQRLAVDLAIDGRITWLGWRDDARDVLKELDVVVLASRYEALGRVLIEAGLAALPVVATRVTGTAEAVIDGETGLLVPPDDPAALARAITTVLEDEKLAMQMGRRGRENALRRFDPRETARSYESLYRDVLTRRRVPSLGRRGARTTGA
jgi:glycosyltransferase involved in cell wall biosynthesis